MFGMPWTRKENDRIRRSTKSDKELAAELGRTAGAVRKQRYRLKHPERVKSDNQRRGENRSENSRLSNQRRKSDPEKRREDKKRNYALGGGKPEKTKRSWTKADDAAITSKKGGRTDRQLAKKTGRSVRAIQGRRGRLQGK